ncbi:hypothetical protein [Acidovorax sp.]|uniref:hypothetical protein n=1 Tax=Acidovorax sp. TaxID=1872122 RepID=UPI00391B5198
MKSDPVRCKPYLRAVAGLRCIHCGVLGYSQCAHANTGKGASIKVSDLDSFPLCTVHPGPDGTLVQGCHERFDQGALFSKAVRRELEPAWAADTQRRILAMGLWPKNLPRPVFLEEETTMTEPDEAKNDIERKMLQGLGTELNHQSHEVLNFHMTGQVGEDPTGTIWTVPVAKGVVDVIIKEIRA